MSGRNGTAGLPLVLAGLLVACGAGEAGMVSTPPPRDVTVAFGDIMIERTVEAGTVRHELLAPANAAWSALADAYRDLGLEIATSNTRTRTVGNMRLTARRTLAGEPMARFFNCGTSPVGAPMANTHRLEIRILSRVVEEGDRHSRLETDLEARAYPVGTSTRATECSSRGVLEDRIAAALVLRLAQR